MRATHVHILVCNVYKHVIIDQGDFKVIKITRNVNNSCLIAICVITCVIGENLSAEVNDQTILLISRNRKNQMFIYFNFSRESPSNFYIQGFFNEIKAILLIGYYTKSCNSLSYNPFLTF